MTVGHRIKNLRKEKNMTLRELSHKTGISVSFLSDIENGRSNPSLERLKDIAGVLDVTVSFLMGEEEKASNHISTKAYHTLDATGLSEEDIRKVEEYIELLRQKYNPNGTLKDK